VARPSIFILGNDGTPISKENNVRPIPYHIARHYEAPKMYLSVADSRRLAIEMPIGDQFGGPAYGMRAMPVVAVALAATSFVSGVAAFTAATTLGGMIAAGATIVGSALSIIGTVTGNSKLAKIGGVLAIGGMVGTGLVNSAAESAATSAASEGAAEVGSEAASAGGEAVNEGARFSDAAFDAGMPGAASTAPGASLSPAAGDGLINARPITDAQSQAVVDASSAAPAQNVTPTNAAEPFSTGAGNSMDAGATQTGQATNMNAFDPEIAKLTRQQAMAQNGGLLNANLPTADLGGGYFDKFGRWVKDNKELAYLGTNFASGLLPSEKDRAMSEAYKQQADAARKRAIWASGRTS
jgi:hypothetical protein